VNKTVGPALLRSRTALPSTDSWPPCAIERLSKLPMNFRVRRACPQRAGRVPDSSSGSPGRTRPTEFHGRKHGSETYGSSHESAADSRLPQIAEEQFVVAPNSWGPRKLPMNRLFGPRPSGRFNARLRRVHGSSLKAAVRAVFGSWAMGMASWPRKLPMNPRTPSPLPGGELATKARKAAPLLGEKGVGSWGVCMASWPWKLCMNHTR